jgi:hypothetical protein
MTSLLSYNADKTIRVELDVVLHRLLIYKLVDGYYELFQIIDIDKIPFTGYKKIHISDSGKVITLLQEHQTVNTLFTDQYVQKGSCYVAHYSFLTNIQ